MLNNINSIDNQSLIKTEFLTKNKDTKVTIIVPVYNSAPQLDSCLRSIIRQTYSNIELILVDDGSTDGSRGICNEYAMKDQRIKLITQTNSGVSAARNNGINNATGEYVTFVDSDDYLDLDSIETMIKIIKDQNVEILRTSARFVNRNKKRILQEKIKLGIYRDSEIQSLAFSVAVWDMMSYSFLLMIKKQFLDDSKVKFPEGISMMEDIYFIMDLFRSATSVFVSDVITYNYVFNREGATYSIDNFEEKINSIINVSNHITGNRLVSDKKHEINAVYVSAVAGRVLAKSYSANVDQVRNMLNSVAKNKAFFELYNNSDTENLSLTKKIAIWSVIGNRLIFTQAIRLARRAVRI